MSHQYFVFDDISTEKKSEIENRRGERLV